jgi:hypothetical protein
MLTGSKAFQSKGPLVDRLPINKAHFLVDRKDFLPFNWVQYLFNRKETLPNKEVPVPF